MTGGSAKAGGFDLIVKFGPTYYPYYPVVSTYPVYPPAIYTPSYYPYYPSLYVPKPIVVAPVYRVGGFGYPTYPAFPPHHHHHHK
jgi:hypothetical protein